MIRLADGSIGEGERHPIAAACGIDFADPIHRRADGDGQRGCGGAGRCVGIGLAFATIAYSAVDVGIPHAASADSAEAAAACKARDVACAGVLPAAHHGGIDFVCCAGAVVVNAVANLSAGAVVLRAANGPASAAARRAGITNAGQPCIACEASAWVAFVCCAGAVVVEAVADFGCWRDVLVASDCASRACRCAGAADAWFSCAANGAAAWVSFVCGAIAFVVYAVADLGAWHCVLAAHHGARSADRRAE